MTGRTFVALLRGVNVSGRNPLAMKDLRTLVEAAGGTGVETYLQSGNVVFRSDAASPERLRERLEARLHQQTGQDTTVLVRTAEQMQQVLSANPLWSDDRDRTCFHVTFLASPPESDRVSALNEAVDDEATDLFRLGPREVYLYCPNGYGRTKLNNAFFERKLAVRATTRNWRTVTALAEMAGA